MRCDECIEAILRLNAPRITRLLLEEPYVPERLMERLATDLDAGVAMAASERLGAARAGGEPAARWSEIDDTADQVSPFATTVELSPVDDAATSSDLELGWLAGESPGGTGDRTHDEDDRAEPVPLSPHAPAPASSEWSDW